MLKTRPDRGGARTRILLTALEEFATRGFDGVSTTEIAKAAGVTQPLIHYHFKTKDALWRATVDYAFHILGKELGETIDQVGISDWTTSEVNIRKSVISLLEKLVDLSARYPSIHRFVLREGIQDTERLSWMVEHHLQPISQLLIKGIYEPGIAMGLLKPLPWPQMVAIVVSGASNFYSMAPMIVKTFGINPHDSEQQQQHMNTLAEMVFSGIIKVEAIKN